MRRSIIPLSLILLFVAIGTGPTLGNAATSRNEWLVQESSGTVTVKGASNDMHALSIGVGTHLSAPFTVQTGVDGHIVITHGEDRLTVRPQTLTSVALSTPSEKGVITRVSQTIGAVLYQVEHRINDRFEVDTPYLVSVVKGTTFNIHVTSDSSTVP